jgi:pimeloyl-ACP methyl ester carboxylesterase
MPERFGSAIPKARIGAMDAKTLRRPLAQMAERLYEEPTTETAAQLLEASLRSDDELVRVSAAASYFEISTQPQRLIKILADGTRSKDILVRDVAATALARIAPEHPSLRALTKSNPTKTKKKPSRTSLLVHGTFARSASWWQPGGDFHSFALASVRPDLYSAQDRFEWSGGYSDSARSIGATDLRNWVAARGLGGLDLFGHSHGANIAMLATQSGLTVGTLVLLSCPVHIPKYIADFTRVTRCVSVHVRMDLVVLADRGGQKFNHPNIEENVLPVWFDHAATHDPAVWRRHGVKARLGL